MNWLNAPDGNKKQHLQMFATGNIKDIDRIHERNRRRKINGLFWFLFIISLIIAWSFYSVRDTKTALYFFAFAVLMLVILVFRYGWNRHLKLPKRSGKGDWERIDNLPNWAYRKMKKRRTNRVNGEHYVYKKEGNKFYRKLK